MPPVRRRELLKGTAGAIVASQTAGCGDSSPPAARVPVAFLHGVASGDPAQDRVILWTRVTPESDPSGAIPVRWTVAADPEMAQPVTAGRAFAEADDDYTVKLDVAGLQPGTTYYYAFEASDARSVTGRTRTLPAGAVERLRLAVVCCNDFQRGLFHAFRRVAERHDLDAVVHLGDYIYEREARDGAVRLPDPPDRDAHTLDDYRRRYRQYRSDADLQELHRQHPLIWIWDDHEFANNAWRDGASRHTDDVHGPWPDRLAAGLKAALEWLPIRSPDPSDPLRIYRDFAFGDLARLIMLDTRIIGRDEPLEENTVFGDTLPAFSQTGGFADPARHILGAPQETWLSDRLRADGTRWRLVGNQVMFAQVKLVGAPRSLGGGLYGNPDQWDGYEPARDRIFAVLQEPDVDNVVFLSGDFHVSFAAELNPDPHNALAYNPLTGAGSVAVDLVTTSISSAGDPGPPLGNLLDPLALLEELIVGNPAAFRLTNPHIKHAGGENGYTVIDLTPERMHAEFWTVPQVGTPTDEQQLQAAFIVRDGEARLQRADRPADPPADTPAPAP